MIGPSRSAGAGSPLTGAGRDALPRVQRYVSTVSFAASPVFNLHPHGRAASDRAGARPYHIGPTLELTFHLR